MAERVIDYPLKEHRLIISQEEATRLLEQRGAFFMEATGRDCHTGLVRKVYLWLRNYIEPTVKPFSGPITRTANQIPSLQGHIVMLFNLGGSQLM